MKKLLPALAGLLLSCGVSNDPGDADDETLDDPPPGDLSDTHTPDSTDTRVDSDATNPDASDPDADPPLGICGVYCMTEYRPCPDGAMCEYGAIELVNSCTDDGCGLCAWIPTECDPEDEPSCGCDGVIYANPCERRRAHVLPDFTWASCYTDS